MLLTLRIFNSATGTRSSRKIRTRCELDVACRVIVGEDLPDIVGLRRDLGGEDELRFIDQGLGVAAPARPD